jgi:hypothetical protein
VSILQTLLEQEKQPCLALTSIPLPQGEEDAKRQVSALVNFPLARRFAICQIDAVKLIVRVLGIVVLVVLLLIVISFALPAQTKHTRVVILKQTPEKVFAVLFDVEKLPTWNRNLEKVELLPPIDGKDAMKQTFKGGTSMTVVTTESLAPTHVVRSVREVSGNAFSGSWRYEITPTTDGCEVALTEKSYIKKPIFRLMTRLFGSTRYIDQHLVDLAKHFGETPTLRWGVLRPRR